VPEFSHTVVEVVVRRLRSRNRVPGPDGITSQVWGVVHNVRSLALNAAFNTCLRSGIIPGCWKRVRLSLLSKPGKPKGVPSSYRPLCLLNDVGKILETFLVNRMERFMADLGIELSDR